MAQDPLAKALTDNMAKTGTKLRVVVVYTGGTFACIETPEGLLNPVKSKEELEQLLYDGLNLGSFVEQGLLELDVIHLFSIDSSQMTDEDREKIIQTLYSEYAYFDGVIVIHGTDTGADTAKFLHLALPYNNPLNLWRENRHVFNWVKPVILLSSQVPAGYRYNNKLTPRMHSDGPMNFALALLMIAEGIVGESGIVTNSESALRGSATTKGAEIDIPPFRCDPGVEDIARYTAMGLRYSAQGYLRKVDSNQPSTPTIVENSFKYGPKVMTVQDSTHLAVLKAYLDAAKNKKADIKKYMENILPDIIIYETKGAGNMKGEDYDILKQILDLGIAGFRVPIPGGRIPPQQIYDVPGHDIQPLNMQLPTAQYKAMMTLALADKLGIKKKEKNKFINYMMTEPWANEFLPQR